MKHQIIVLFSALQFLGLFNAANAGDTINVMIVATPAAIAKLGGPEATGQKVKTDIDNINQSFRNSNIDGYVRVVYTNSFSSDILNTFCMYDMLNQILTVRTEELRALHTMRTTVAADVVIIIVDEPSKCGLSGEFGDPSQAFILVHYECLGANYSMARELGYLLGCGNYETQSGRFNPDPDNTSAYGYVSDYEDDNTQESPFSTIMGYTDEYISSNEDDFNMIPYWSSADTINLRYFNRRIGDQYHDNAEQIRKSMAVVAGYRNPFGSQKIDNMIVEPYNIIRMTVKRKLDAADIDFEANTQGELKSRKVKLKDGVIIKKGARVKIISKQ